MLRLSLALFAIQAGFHGFTASLPLALGRAGRPDPEIGLIVGSAALVQVPAAFAAGALVDRFGGVRLLFAGSLAYLAASAILLLPGVDPAGSPVPFLAARILQGIGIGATLPSAFSLVPRLVAVARRGFALAFVGGAHNLTLVVLPPLSLQVLDRAGLDGVAVMVAVMTLAGAAVAMALPLGPVAADPAADELRPAARRLGFAVRSSWTVLLAIVLLYVAHWGAVTAYLPQRAAAAGADIGLFFAADGIAILLARVPTGWLADRIAARLLIAAGIATTAAAVAMLLLPPTTPLLVTSGLLGGAGGGLVLTPILVELSRRSGDADRGSAFALFSAALAGAIALGSVGGSPIVAVAGFGGAIVAGLGAMAIAFGLAFADTGLGRPARGGPA